jgi:uncharacterized protein (UPF0548 family)
MFFLSKPDEVRIRTVLESQQGCGFSYPKVGATQGELPTGWAVLRGRAVLGSGPATFERAVKAICQWKMFEVSGIELCWPSVPIQPESSVAIVIRHFGFWSVNCCKIVYVIDEDGPVRRFGFAYGTLPEHAEQGEERFVVEWDRASDLVCYDILSFSRPGNAVVKVAYPAAHWLQRRFVRDSLAAMARAARPK